MGGALSNRLTLSGGVISDNVGSRYYPWIRFNGPLDDAAKVLATDVKAEITCANWKVGQRIPSLAWLAGKGRASAEAAAAAVGLLEQDGWIAAEPTGGYLICVPVPLSIPESRDWSTPIPTREKPKRTTTAKRITPRKPKKRPLNPVPRKAPRVRLLNYVTYVIGIDGLPFVKIGHTTTAPEKRLKTLQTGQPMALRLLCYVEGDYEYDLHSHFEAYRIRGEWFDLSSLGDPVQVVQAAVDEIESRA